MQSYRADARQQSRACSPANNGTSPGRLRLPRYLPDGSLRLQPPPTRTTTPVEAGHPMPVDLSCLGNLCKIANACITGNPECICHAGRPPVSLGRTTNPDLSASTSRPTLPPRISHKAGPRVLLSQFDERRKRFIPAVIGSCRLQSVEPDVSALVGDSEAQFHEVCVLVHDRDFRVWFDTLDPSGRDTGVTSSPLPG